LITWIENVKSMLHECVEDAIGRDNLCTDDSKLVILRFIHSYPIHLILSEGRKNSAHNQGKEAGSKTKQNKKLTLLK
jgi:hypothetical protein